MLKALLKELVRRTPFQPCKGFADCLRTVNSADAKSSDHLEMANVILLGVRKFNPESLQPVEKLVELVALTP